MTRPMLLAWSGGKDSALALEEMRRDPRFDVIGLFTTVTESDGCTTHHGAPPALTALQAERAGLPLYAVPVPGDGDQETYQRVMGEAIQRLKAELPELEGFVFGDLFLEDLRIRRTRLLARASLSAYFPLWQRSSYDLARKLLARGYRALLVSVDTAKLPEDFAGREYDENLLSNLPPGVDPCGENGEFHTFVYDGPIFEQPIPFIRGERARRDGPFAYWPVLPVAR
ncbi:adenine nucleotide alpha hydrolase [bacterium]|nr:adenine nucleotide alpha hydrolase [bacterium]